jgi:colanic acid biosynthesis glycosyl transferase WcaI
MRILLITLWFPPEPRKLLGELAGTLRDLGHEVTVLTGFPNWPTGRVYPGYRIRLWQREVLDGVSVIRVAMYPDHSHNRLKRALNFLSFSVVAALISPFLLPKHDVIYAVQPIPAGLPAMFLSWCWKVPFVLGIFDLWPDSLAATGFADRGPLMSLMGKAIDFVQRRCALMTVISDGFRRTLIERGVEPRKIRLLHNWVDTEHYHSGPSGRLRIAEIVGENKFTIIFAGLIGPAQELSVVIKAAQLVKSLPRIRFLIVGDGIEKGRLEDAARQIGLDNVVFLGWQPEDDMPGILGQASALLLHLRDEPLFRITIPHKVYAYLAMGKPILAALAGDAADVVRSANAGVICPPGSPEELANAVIRLASMPQAYLDELGANGRQTASAKYERRVQVKRLEAILSEAQFC